MHIDSMVKISFSKRELRSLVDILEKEKGRYDAIDHSQLGDDESGEMGDEHEVVCTMLSMLRAHYENSF